jgi:CBS domain containing-hemolysin-like protein
MLARKQHMGIVLDADDRLLGVLTMEDIIEEVIQQEIIDEDDHVVEVRNGAVARDAHTRPVPASASVVRISNTASGSA